MISYPEALKRILKTPAVPETERVHTLVAEGRIISEEIVANADFPRFTNSSMDGFTFSSDNGGNKGRKLEIVGESAAGSPFHGQVSKDQCIRISTGAPLPDSTDTVVPREFAQEADRAIAIQQEIKNGNAVRKAGSDLKTGTSLIGPGTWLDSRHMAILSMLNHTSVRVYRKPRVGILTSGNELRPLGSPLNKSAIINTNGCYLKSALERMGCVVTDFGISRDEPAAFRSLLAKALETSDFIISTAGVSVGDHDVVPDAIDALGGETIFWKVSVRPGKPLLFAHFHQNDGRLIPFFGFPGNPISVFTGIEIFLKPWIFKHYGLKYEAARLSLPLIKTCSPDRKRLFFALGKESQSGVEVLENQSSGNLSNILKANCFVRLEPGEEMVPEGTMMTVVPI